MTPTPSKPFPKIFRAYDYDAKKMYSPDDLMAMGVFLAPTGHLMKMGGDRMNIKLLFYTGQNDNDGKPLFDGDICKVGVSLDLGIGYPSIVEKWAVMRWVNEKMSFALLVPKIIGNDGNFNLSYCKLHGNEYMNPELVANLEIE